jgi:hypothetical protein
MALRRREVTEILNTKHSIALCGDLVLEGAMGVSERRLQNERKKERKKERMNE